MLIRTNRIRVAYYDFRPAFSRPDAVRNDPVRRIVSTANHVTGPHGRYRDSLLFQKRFDITCRYKLGTGFGVGIRVKAIQFFIFPISPFPFPVLIYLIRCNIDDRFNAFRLTDAFQNIHRSHHIHIIRIYRISVGFPHDRLGRHVNHNLRAALLKSLLQGIQIPDIPFYGLHTLIQRKHLKQRAWSIRHQCIPCHICSCFQKRFTHPGTFKTGMSGNKYFSVFILLQCIHALLLIIISSGPIPQHCVLSGSSLPTFPPSFPDRRQPRRNPS